MPLPDIKLPNDTEALKEMLLELYRKNLQLEHRLEVLLRQRYGQSSERMDERQGLLEFALEDWEEETKPEQPSEETAEEDRPRRKKSRLRHRKLENVPHKRIEHTVPKEERRCSCCNQPKEKIGEEETKQLEYIPASLYVLVHARFKYACRHCQEGVTIAPPPDLIFDKGLPGPGLLAKVLADKYGTHIPLHRQEELFARYGVEIPRSTQCRWVQICADLLRPIVDFMKQEVLQSRKIHTDDTPVKVLEKGRGKTRTGRFWNYLGDNDHPHVFYEYTPHRKRDGPSGPADVLKGFSGYLQADAYAGYDELYETKAIIEVACWSHVRRKFFEAKESDARAYDAIVLIRELYAVEKRGCKLSAEERRALRCTVSTPVLDRLKKWLDARTVDCLPKSPLGQAAGYALRQWEALNRFLEDGILAIDNNAAENILRPIALGRKNWLFCGSDNGGKSAAIIYSLVGSCRLHKIDPWAYFKDVLVRVSKDSAMTKRDLTPAYWKLQE